MKKVVLVSAEWCTSCKPVKILLEEISNEYEFTYEKLDADNDPERVAKLGVRGLPTVLVYHQDKLKNTLVGSKTKQEFISAIME